MATKDETVLKYLLYVGVLRSRTNNLQYIDGMLFYTRTSTYIATLEILTYNTIRFCCECVQKKKSTKDFRGCAIY